MGLTLRDTFPAIRQGLGFPTTLRLSSLLTLAALKTGIDQVTVSPALKKCNQGYALTVATGTIQIENLGAATSGNYVFGLMKNGTQVGAFTVTYAGGGVSAVVDADFRNTNLIGIRFAPGDVLRLDLVALPTGVTTGCSGLKATLFCKTHSIDC